MHPDDASQTVSRTLDPAAAFTRLHAALAAVRGYVRTSRAPAEDGGAAGTSLDAALAPLGMEMGR